MKKVLIFVGCLMLAACVSEKDNVILSQGRTLGNCHMDIQVKDESKVVLTKEIVCPVSFSLSNIGSSNMSITYLSLPNDITSKENGLPAQISFRMLSSKNTVFSTDDGESVLEVPQISQRDVVQRALLKFDKPYYQKVEDVELIITLKP